MKIIKHHSHKRGLEHLQSEKKHLLDELNATITSISPVDFLTKVPEERTKGRHGLLFSPPTLNRLFQQHLYPNGWAEYDLNKKKYHTHRLYFPNVDGGSNRFREMDGIKDHVGLEIQFGKYAFMGYDIFSKMIIFKNSGLITYGIEIVMVQQMVTYMSTGVSAFEQIMIDFEYRGTADIDIPVLVLGIGATEQEWRKVHEIQEVFRADPEEARKKYPQIGRNDLKGHKPGPKP